MTDSDSGYPDSDSDPDSESASGPQPTPEAPSKEKPKRKRGCRWLFIRTLQVFGVLVLLLGLIIGAGMWYFHPKVEYTKGIVYGQRDGYDLTFDVVQPRKPNGHGVVVMVSGSWKSRPKSFRFWLTAPLSRHGYTVFAVAHRSQPDAAVQDTVQDVNRAVRFIRYHAADYGIDPQHIGVTGGSSGGHLSLMLATQGGPGPADAPDPIDRESSAVQAVAIFFPVTNLVDLGESRENARDGGPPKSFRKAFGEEGKNPQKWPTLAEKLSPLYHVHVGQPPVFILHGDADTLVPLQQSQWFRDASEKIGAGPVEVVVRKGRGHGWLSAIFDLRLFAQWFDRYLIAPDDVS